MTSLPSLPLINLPSLNPTERSELKRELNECPPDTLRLVLHGMCARSADIEFGLYRALCIERRPIPQPARTGSIIDLLEDPDADKENATVSTNSNNNKRKAPEDLADVTKKIKSAGKIAKTTSSWRDRYVHCVNCYELFDIVENESLKNSAPASVKRLSSDANSGEHTDEDDSGSNSISNNEYGNCVYHDGYSQVNYDSDFWADHDEDTHGKIDSYELRKEYPEVYTWDCCDKKGDAPGCRRSWHQAGGRLKYYARLQKC